MLEIPSGQFLTWLETQLARKHSLQLQTFKRTFLIFSNLSDQILSLYLRIMDKIEGHPGSHQCKDIRCLLEKSIVIVNLINGPLPLCLDAEFCERFLKTFDNSINLLCTYYHSLSHFELLSKEAKYEKEKIVEGINKLYGLHLNIKDACKSNTPIAQTLNSIWENKKLFTAKLASINSKNNHSNFMSDFETIACRFYEELNDKMQHATSDQNIKKSLLSAYFQLQHQLNSSQAQLQHMLEVPLHICEDLKNRKRATSFLLNESCSNFTKWVGILLKPTLSLKQLKKMKVEQVMKHMNNILKEKDSAEKSFKSEEQIQCLLVLIMEIVKQLDKIDQSGMLTMINDYRENLMPSSGQQFISCLIDYQADMNRVYALHEQIKQFQQLAQLVALEEFNVRVNITFD